MLRGRALDNTGTQTWAIAGLSLALGFAVAEITGVRAIGGAILIAAVAWCYPRWRTTGKAPLLIVVYAAAFVASHVIGLATGAWPAVAIAAATVAGVTYRVENRP